MNLPLVVVAVVLVGIVLNVEGDNIVVVVVVVCAFGVVIAVDTVVEFLVVFGVAVDDGGTGKSEIYT